MQAIRKDIWSEQKGYIVWYKGGIEVDKGREANLTRTYSYLGRSRKLDVFNIIPSFSALALNSSSSRFTESWSESS